MKAYIVDSFTREAFKGNPAGVCFPDRNMSNNEMLQIANELGLSETAFVYSGNKEDTYNIKFFSPKMEIPLCGHATLAAAKVVFCNTGISNVHFITAEKLDLKVIYENGEIVMEFPVYETIPMTAPAGTLKALGIAEVIEGRFNDKLKIILLEIADAELLAQIKPDFEALVHSYEGINGILVTAASNSANYDYHYRYFWPWSGTNEDPVTGGVQTFLAKYWQNKLAKTKMNAFQSSSRTGSMSIELIGNSVLLKGHAVIILEGNLLVSNGK